MQRKSRRDFTVDVSLCRNLQQAKERTEPTHAAEAHISIRSGRGTPPDVTVDRSAKGGCHGVVNWQHCDQKADHKV